MPPSSQHPSNTASTSSQPASSTTKSSSWTPEPIRILFSHFPLHVLPANRLPSRSLSPSARRRHTLFLFTTAAQDDKTAAKTPSYNPTCLKWQTYLLMRGVDFDVRTSSNHASPRGSLPFLISAENSAEGTSAKEKNTSPPVPSNSRSDTISASGLQAWLSTQESKTPIQRQPSDTDSPSAAVRESTYLSLIDHRLRPAWLHAFYLTPNLQSLAAPLYIHSATSSLWVRYWQTIQLRAAALAEVRKVYPLVERPGKDGAVDVLYAAAEEALRALEAALGDGEWFFGDEKPGMLDAAVFAYTGLLLDDELGGDVNGRWDDGDGGRRLRTLVEQFDGLRRHRERVLQMFFL